MNLFFNSTVERWEGGEDNFLLSVPKAKIIKVVYQLRFAVRLLGGKSFLLALYHLPSADALSSTAVASTFGETNERILVKVLIKLYNLICVNRNFVDRKLTDNRKRENCRGRINMKRKTSLSRGARLRFDTQHKYL